MPPSVSAFTRRPWVRRTLIGCAGLLGLLVLLVLFAWLALPGIIKSQAEQMVFEKLQRRMTIGAIEIRPFELSATVRDLKLMEPNADRVFAGFETLAVNLSSYSVLRLAPVVQEVRLAKPYVRLVRNEANHYNIDDILKLVAEQPPSPEPARFSVNNIQVEDGRIEFDDQPVGKTHVVSQLKLGIPFVSSLPSQVQVYVEPLLSAMVNDTPLLVKGRARPFAETQDAVVDIDLDRLDVTQLVGYLPFQPGFKISGATLDAKLEASFQQPKDKTPLLLVSGTAALKSLVLTEPGGKPLLKLPELAISLDKASLFDSRLAVARIGVTGLDVDLTRDHNGEFALQRAMAPAKAANPANQDTAAAPVAAPKAAAPMFMLGELAIRDANLRYGDEFGARPMRAGVEKMDLTLRNIAIDTGKQTVAIEEVASERAGLTLQQGKAGKTANPAPAPAVAANGKADEAGGYVVTVGKTRIENWTARLEDNAMARPVVTNIAPLALSLQDFSTAPATRSKLDIRASVNKVGAIDVGGTVGAAPLHADLKIDLKNVDVLPLQPYFTDKVNLLVTRASVSGKGALQLDQPANGPLKGGFKGDLTLGNLATVDKLSTTDFLRWKSLFFGGVDVKLEPFALAVEQVALSDFYARVIIDPNGRINLQDIARSPAEAAKSLTDGEAKPAAPNAETKPATAVAAAPAASTASAARPPITIRKLTLQGGQVRFTDNFIKPNYTANLNGFGGQVSGLSSDPASNANLDMRGEVNSAPVSIAGRINPLKGDLTMDIQANVRGMELAPLTPYSGRYIGYGIEKGKLSFEVAYKVENRVLTAQNRLILEQLTLGDKIESPTATKLPVQLALALLRDRNGVIDINLPIGGSLDDPQFSVGGLIVKVIVNVLTKAITAPFALLGSLFGGDGSELSWLEFEPGRAAIAPAAEEKLKTLAKALADRPALKLEITGRVDAETDRASLKRASIDRKVRALKLKDMVARGESAAAADVVVKADEYPALLERVYKDEKFPKPRNLIGLQKGLPVAEMEKLMTVNAEVDGDDVTNLGNRRAQAAKDWLLKNGQVPAERVFLLATKPAEAEAKDPAAKPTRVDFSLR